MSVKNQVGFQEVEKMLNYAKLCAESVNAPSPMYANNNAVDSETNPSSSGATTSQSVVVCVDKHTIIPNLFGVNVYFPYNHLENLRQKISAAIPGFVAARIDDFREKIMNQWEFLKPHANYFTKENESAVTDALNVASIVGLFVVQNYYFPAIGLYFMWVESTKLLVAGERKQAACTFMMGGVVCYFSFTLSVITAIGMAIEYNNKRNATLQGSDIEVINPSEHIRKNPGADFDQTAEV